MYSCRTDSVSAWTAEVGVGNPSVGVERSFDKGSIMVVGEKLEQLSGLDMIWL